MAKVSAHSVNIGFSKTRRMIYLRNLVLNVKGVLIKHWEGEILIDYKNVILLYVILTCFFLTEIQLET